MFLNGIHVYKFVLFIAIVIHAKNAFLGLFGSVEF